MAFGDRKKTDFHKKPRKPMKRSGFKAPSKAQKGSKVKKKAKKAPKTQAKLKKELDALFSKYIRAKYLKECYTCRKVDVTLQCGHFVSRQYLATRWDENNCRPQCVGCNIFGNGKPLDFEERLKKDLGDQFVEDMKLTRHNSLKLSRVWYIEQIDNYKKILKGMVQ
jgi:5-methylcytosine-specific restriction endonuclease McrA